MLRIVISVLAAMNVSCSLDPLSKRSQTQELVRAVNVNEKSTSDNSKVTIPKEIENELFPTIGGSDLLGSVSNINSRMDVAVNKVPAKSFFIGLSKRSSYNMVVHPGVEGYITLSMRGVTVDEVMKTVKNIYGYDYVKTESSYEVFPSVMRSKVYKVDYLNVTRSGISQTRVSSGQLTDNKSVPGVKNDDASGTSVNTKTNADFWTELEKALKGMVGEKDGRSVSVNPQANLVVVKAMPSELRSVDYFIEALHSSLQRQVILEAKIVEVELSEGFQAGVNWSGAMAQGNDGLAINQTGGGTLLSGSEVSDIAGNAITISPGTSPSGSVNITPFGGIFSAALATGDFAAFMEFLKTQGSVQVLSSPRVSTVNNQKAVIKVGSDEFFVTQISVTPSVSSTDQASQMDVELTPFFSGIALDVVPQIAENGEVILHIHPSVSEVVEKTKYVNLSSDQEMRLPLAYSTIRESDSIVRASSGQTVVIGGLMHSQLKEQTAKVPLLGDLPLLGALFKQIKKRSVKSELVFLIRPVVVDSNSQWRAILEDSGNRIEKMTN